MEQPIRTAIGAFTRAKMNLQDLLPIGHQGPYPVAKLGARWRQEDSRLVLYPGERDEHTWRGTIKWRGEINAGHGLVCEGVTAFEMHNPNAEPCIVLVDRDMEVIQ